MTLYVHVASNHLNTDLVRQSSPKWCLLIVGPLQNCITLLIKRAMCCNLTLIKQLENAEAVSADKDCGSGNYCKYLDMFHSCRNVASPGTLQGTSGRLTTSLAC